MAVLYFGCLLVIVSFDRNAVFGGEGEEVVPMYPVLTPGQPESHQVPLLNPAQDGHFTDAAVPGHNTGGEIFRIGAYQPCMQVMPPLQPTCPDGRKSSGFFLLTLFTRLTNLTKILAIL
jgi:hypothetical protein